MNKLIIFLGVLALASAYPDEILRWKSISYRDPPKDLNSKIGSDPYYTKMNNVPLGITVWKNKMILAIPRWAPGVVSTVNVIDTKDLQHHHHTDHLHLYDSSRSPKVTAYPSYTANELTASNTPNNKKIVNVYQTRADACDRLWFVDVGTLEYGQEGRNPIYIQNPAIWIIDLKTGKTIRRIDLGDSFGEKGSLTGFYSLSVDVDEKNCHDAYAYIPVYNQIITYSYKKDQFWSNRATISAKPIIISIALGKPSKSGSRTAYLHLDPSPDTTVDNIEFSISTSVLKRNDNNYITLNNLGVRDGDSVMHDIDTKTNVMFGTSYSRNAIFCWDTAKDLKPQNIATIHQDDFTMRGARDLQVDSKGYAWYMSSRWEEFVSNGLDADDWNFRVFRFNTRNEIRSNICNPYRLS